MANDQMNIAELRIKKIRVFPPGEINWHNKAYLGLSINNRVFQQIQPLTEILEFLNSHVSNVALLVGDNLHRYNEMIYSGLDEVSAKEIASIKSLRAIDLFFEVLAQFENLKVDVIRTSDYTDDISLLDSIGKFNLIYSSNPPFKKLIDCTVDIFLKRQTSVAIDIDEAKILCKNYILEELAIFEIIARNGYKINIYPGNQLPVIKELVTKKLSGVSEILEEIQAVEIKFRPK